MFIYIYIYTDAFYLKAHRYVCIYICKHIKYKPYTYLERDQDNIRKRFNFSLFFCGGRLYPISMDTPEFCSNNRSNCQKWEYFRKGCSVLGYLVWVSSFSPWVVVSCRLVSKKSNRTLLTMMTDVDVELLLLNQRFNKLNIYDWLAYNHCVPNRRIYVWKESKKGPTKTTDGTYPKTCPIWARFQSRQKDFPSRRRFPPRRRRVFFQDWFVS